MPFGLPASAAEIVALPTDEVAMRMLREFASGGSRINRDDLANPPSWGDMANVAAANRAMLVRVQEAWDWLVVHGLITRDPTQSSPGWGAVTDAGREAARDPRGKARTLAIQRLGVDLHPRLAARVRPQFLLGDYELAAFAAMKEIEVRVRELSGSPNSLLGTKLMQECFKPGGALHDPEVEPGESEGMMALFRGAISVFKNPASHREVTFEDPTLAAEVVLFADLLLRLLDARAATLGLTS
jgi:uncharacterized protein (TIGR02391 family)